MCKHIFVSLIWLIYTSLVHLINMHRRLANAAVLFWWMFVNYLSPRSIWWVLLKFAFLIVLTINETLFGYSKHHSFQLNIQMLYYRRIKWPRQRWYSLSLSSKMRIWQHNRELHLLISFSSDLVRFQFLQPSSPLPPLLLYKNDSSEFECRAWHLKLGC